MEQYQPNEVTTRVRRLLGREMRRIPTRGVTLPVRRLLDHPDCLFGPRHFLAVDVTEPERPVMNGVLLDLRRSGWELDKALVRGALAAAAWCCRLGDGQSMPMSDLRGRYLAFVHERGTRGLDPFDTALISAPPWQLVVTVLERLARPTITSAGPRYKTTESTNPADG